MIPSAFRNKTWWFGVSCFTCGGLVARFHDTHERGAATLILGILMVLIAERIDP